MKKIFFKKEKGFTLTEMFVTVGVFTIIIGIVAAFFSTTRRDFTHFEVLNQLKSCSQKSLNLINHKLSVSKRLFENVANDIAYESRLNLTGEPSVLTGSKLPIIEENGSISPSSSNFVSSSVGNKIFFTSSEEPLIATNILDSSGSSHTLRIDIYTFHYYYLTLDTSKDIAGQGGRYDIIGWHSIRYADYSEITAISDATERSNLVKYIYNSGINYAWVPSSTDVNNAFYILSASGNLTLDSSHVIQKDYSKSTIKITTGMLGATFRYGVAFNTGTGFNIQYPVPLFATSSGSFPGGLEVVIVGPNNGRQVFIRLVLVAQSGAGLQSYEQTSLTSVRDLW